MEGFLRKEENSQNPCLRKAFKRMDAKGNTKESLVKWTQDRTAQPWRITIQEDPRTKEQCSESQEEKEKEKNLFEIRLESK